MTKCRTGWQVHLLMLGFALTVHGAGLYWLPSQFLPTFSTPTPTIDCISMDGLGAAQQALFISLEGIVNRTQPRIACVNSASEGAFTWLDIHNLHYTTINGFSAIQKYQTQVTGLVVTDPNQPDTLNLATTIAGVRDELICDPSLLSTLTNAPYNLPVKDDLRGMFSNKYQVYGYLYTNYWPQCTHRIVGGLSYGTYRHFRDYLIAVKAAVVWLDPNVTADANALSPFISQMTPVAGVYVGWWPNEGADMDWIGTYGIPVMASDLFDNGSVYGGVTTQINVPPIPPIPTLQNKVYISMTLSDGDNAQYMEHAMKLSWDSVARGTVPIGWTVQPLLADFDPGMLNYYWSTATTNDCLISGPSGAGYNHIEKWSSGHVVAYTKASNPYLQETGLRTATVWNTVSTATANAYATNCPVLAGINDQNGGYYATSRMGLPVLGFPTDGNYATNAAGLLYVITNTAKNWNGSSPMFVATQARTWTVSPSDLQWVASQLSSSKYIVVRPDQLFLLYQKWAGLSQGGAKPYVATQPVSQLTGVGSNVTFTVTASGSGPLSYQWQFNGANIANATNNTCVISNALASDVGNYQALITNLYGSVTSSLAALTFGNQPLGFNGDGLNWTANQGGGFFVYSPPAIADNLLTLTDGESGETRSFFFSNPQYIGAFKATFTYQAGGNKAADGVSFCLQNDPRGATALGGGVANLGVGGTSGIQITPSLELELNLSFGNNQNIGYAVLTNGLTCAGGANGNYRVPGSVQINSGDPINITVSYANSEMALTFTDAVARTSFATNLNVGDLTQIVGADTACVGFTGADGASTSIQTISGFSFTSIPTAAIQLQDTNALVSWPAAAPGYVLQQNSDLTTPNWVNVTNPKNLTNGLNQVTVPNNGSNLFYRLVLHSP